MADGPTVGAAPAKAAVWNDPRYRALFYQSLLVILVGLVGWYLIDNTIDNLRRLDVSTGFDFLDRAADFSIIQTLIPYSESSSYWRAFLVSLLNTLVLSAIGIILATLLGFTVGVARLSSNWLVSKLAAAYVEIFRNIPLLLQIFFWYNAILKPLPGPHKSIHFGGGFVLNNRGFYFPDVSPHIGGWIALALFCTGVVVAFWLRGWARRRQSRTGDQFPVAKWASILIFVVPASVFALIWLLFGLPLRFDLPKLQGFNFTGGVVLIPEFIAMLIALVAYTAAYIAENVRSGIMAINQGQTEAAAALGLQPQKVLSLVVIPQALRVIIPPLTNQYLNLIKNSSLAVAIAYPDLVAVFMGTVLNNGGQAVEIVGITMATYLTISLLTSLFMNWYNARIALAER